MTRTTFLLLVPSAWIACALAGGEGTNADQDPGLAATQVTAADTHAGIGRRVEGDGQLTEYVRRIFQDSKGHYWFGSNGDGIYRYDGTTLEVFSTDEGLAGAQVTGILEDRNGNIWISTDGGVSRYAPSTLLGANAFTNYTKKDGLPSDGCWSIFEARDGTIWVGTAAGLRRSRSGASSGGGLRFEPLVLTMGAVQDTVGQTYWISSIAQDRKGDMWFATRDAGILRYDGRVLQQLTTKDGLTDNEMAGMLVDSKDQLWFGSMSGGLTHYDPSTSLRTGRNTMQHFAAPDIGDNEVWTVFEDRDGDIWFSSERFGVYRYNGSSLRNYSTKQGLGVLAVQTIHQDREGRMWFGGGGGLYRLEGDSMVHVKRNGPWR